MNTLQALPSPFASIKGAKMFAVDEKTRTFICIAVKKKLQLYQLAGGQFNPMPELPLADVPLAMVWYGSKICIGYKREYAILDANTGAHTPIHLQPDPKSAPLVKLMPGDEDGEPVLLLSCLENNRMGVFVGLNGMPGQISNLDFPQTPAAVGSCMPYVISLVANNGIEVLSTVASQEQQLVQRIELKRVKSLVGGKLILVATAEQVQWLQPVPLQNQITTLLSQSHVEEALALLKLTSDAEYEDAVEPAKLQQMYLDIARVLFGQLKVEEATLHFEKGRLDPRELIAYFPQLQPTSFEYRPSELTDVFPGSGKTPDFASAVENRLRSKASARGGMGSGGGGAEGEVQQYVDKAYRSLARFLGSCRERYADGGSKQRGGGGSSTDPSGKIMEAVDTALLKLYVILRHSSLEDFCDAPNECGMQDAKPLLLEHKRYHALATLLQGKGLQREALEVWQKMGIGEYLESGMDGVAPTVALLSQCGHTAKEQELVWVFSFWVLQKQPLEGLKIFTASSPRSQQLSRARRAGVSDGDGASPLPPTRVLQHLESFEGHSKSLCVAYLEDLIYVQRKKYGRKEGAEEEFHTRLANEYIDTALMLIDAGVAVDTRSTSNGPQPPVPGEDAGAAELREVRAKLVRFLRTSDEYDATKLLDRIRCALLYTPLYTLLYTLLYTPL
jgi:hypothetical protein